jgi:hypothetical protein
MLLGFMLPFALAFIAIPLESLIHSGRTVGGALAAALVRVVAFALRLAGNIARHASRVLINVYDVVIVIPLLVERMVTGRSPRPAKPARAGKRGAVMDDVDDAEKTHA